MFTLNKIAKISIRSVEVISVFLFLIVMRLNKFLELYNEYSVLNLVMALSLIWRTLSRVRLNFSPMSSRLIG